MIKITKCERPKHIPIISAATKFEAAGYYFTARLMLITSDELKYRLLQNDFIAKPR